MPLESSLLSSIKSVFPPKNNIGKSLPVYCLTLYIHLLGRDERMLDVLKHTQLPIFVVIVAPGSDGQSSFEQLLNPFKRLDEAGGCLGYFSLLPFVPIFKTYGDPLRSDFFRRTPTIIVDAFEDRLDKQKGGIKVPRGIQRHPEASRGIQPVIPKNKAGQYRWSFAERGEIKLKWEFFLESGVDLIDRLSKIIREQITTEKYGVAKGAILNKMMIQLYKECLMVTSNRKKPFNQKKFAVRWQVEKLLLSNDYKRDILFHGVLVDGLPVKIGLKRDQLLGIDIKFFGKEPYRVSTSEMDAIGISLKTLNKQIIKKRVKILASIVKDNGGKVRFYTTVGIDCERFGIQHISPDVAGRDFKYLERPVGYAELSPHYYEVDFSKGKIDALRTLEKVVGLTMTFYPSGGGMGIRDFLFIVKGVDEEGKFLKWDHPTMICAFNGRKFFTREELLSPEEYIIKDPYCGYEKVVKIEDIVGTFNLKRDNVLWALLSLYHPFTTRNFLTHFRVENSFYN